MSGWSGAYVHDAAVGNVGPWRARQPSPMTRHRADETHRCRVICVPDVARRPSIQRLRTRLASQPSYARMERRECLSASGLRARPRSGVGPAKMGVGCLVMKAVHHLGATPGSALGKRARRACCEFSQHRVAPAWLPDELESVGLIEVAWGASRLAPVAVLRDDLLRLRVDQDHAVVPVICHGDHSVRELDRARGGRARPGAVRAAVDMTGQRRFGSRLRVRAGA